jgi:hypothetical protein
MIGRILSGLKATAEIESEVVKTKKSMRLRGRRNK